MARTSSSDILGLFPKYARFTVLLALLEEAMDEPQSMLKISTYLIEERKL